MDIHVAGRPVPPAIRSRGIAAATIAAQLAALWLLSLAARQLAALLPFPVPPGTVGMLLVCLLLWTGVVPLRAIERGADLLVRHLGLFLVPFAVGLMSFGDLIAERGLALLALLVASTAAGIAVTGLAAQGCARQPAPQPTSRPMEHAP